MAYNRREAEGNFGMQKKWNGNGKGSSWGLIVLLLLFMFPVGIGLMVHKLHVDKENYVINGKRTAVVGWIFVGLGAFYVYCGLSNSIKAGDVGSAVSGIILLFIAFCGGGYLLVRHGNKYKKNGIRYLQYISILRNDSDGSIDNIASLTGDTYETVCVDLQSMIDNNILQDTYIDSYKRVLVAPFIRSLSSERVVEPQAKERKTAEPKAVKCPNCGGINTVESGKGCCEFCGSPLNI